MPGTKREEKIAAAKRKLKQFKQKRGRELKSLKDDTSSVASEDSSLYEADGTNDGLLNSPLRNNVPVKNSETSAGDANVVENDPCNVVSDDNVQVLEMSRNELLKEYSTLPNGINDLTLTPDSKSHEQENTPEIEGNSLATVTNKLAETDRDNLKHENRNVHERIEIETVTISSPTIHELSTSRENNVSMKAEAAQGDIIGDSNVATDTTDKASTANHIIDDYKFSNNDETSSTSTTEKLLQISTKLNGLAAEAQSVMHNHSSNGDSQSVTANGFVLSELEHRNQQLAEQVAIVTRQKQELMLQVEKLTQKMSELHHRLEAEKQQIYAHGINEQNTLRQQLQVQMQTIGILVAEKQELQHQVHEVRSTATQDQNARQRCQDQLQDAKLHVQTLEREVKTSADTIAILNTTKTELVQERDKLQVTLNKINKSNQENNMHAGELTQKLTSKEDECSRLSNELDDLHEKLSMAEVLLQQLSSSSGASAETQLQQLQEERESLNQKLIEYQQAFEQLTGEREQLSRQYEDVNKQMQTQVSELSQQVQLLENEKSDLHIEQEGLQQKIRDLDARNKELSQAKETSQSENLLDQMSSKLQQIQSDLERVSRERDEINQKLHAQLRNNERLARLNEEQEVQLAELGRSMSDSVVSADERTRLLEQSQSDKATISRALTQNKQLKQQLEEMHDGFIKLSNDKMELATNLTTIEHAKSELEEDIEKYKSMLMDVEERLASRDSDVSQLQNDLSQSQIVSEEIEPLKPNLNAELIASQETISILGEQNNHLKSMVTKLQSELDELQQSQDSVKIENEVVSSPDTSVDSSMVETLTTSVYQLEQERELLARKFEEQRQQHESLVEQFLQLQQGRKSDDQNVSLEDHEKLLHNMTLLQDRFSSVMREKVDALSKIEDLEHINLQLQNECDTIGEYITLYHNQRQILKQRHHEKDEYVSSIAQEREHMQLKLEKLQTLVFTLLNSRGVSGASVPQLTSSPLRNPPGSDSTQLNESVLAGLTSDWPDMLEDEDGKRHRKPRPDLLPESVSLPSHSDDDDSMIMDPLDQKTNEHFPGKLQRVEGDALNEESSTATQIINLLEQMQKPNTDEAKEIPQGFCLRYMGPYTAI